MDLPSLRYYLRLRKFRPFYQSGYIHPLDQYKRQMQSDMKDKQLSNLNRLGSKFQIVLLHHFLRVLASHLEDLNQLQKPYLQDLDLQLLLQQQQYQLR